MASNNKLTKEYHGRKLWQEIIEEETFEDQLDALAHNEARPTDGQQQVPDPSPTKLTEDSSDGNSAWPNPPGWWPDDTTDEPREGDLNANPHTEPQLANMRERTRGLRFPNTVLATSVATRSGENMTKENATNERSKRKLNATQHREPQLRNQKLQAPRIAVLGEEQGTSVATRNAEQTTEDGLKPPIPEPPVVEPPVSEPQTPTIEAPKSDQATPTSARSAEKETPERPNPPVSKPPATQPQATDSKKGPSKYSLRRIKSAVLERFASGRGCKGRY